ncbi:MAG: hypothetical protein O7A62_10025 [Alphaproteobacteria bacterium]|nr:hypothetical protein [Alphaproteobacteria bacterium]MCZ6510910.1 hypothetical protein [Alphaproteobacteria bacterium]
MTPEDEKSPAPRPSARGKKRAEEKFERQAASLRANLHRRRQQRRGQDGDEQDGGEPDPE